MNKEYLRKHNKNYVDKLSDEIIDSYKNTQNLKFIDAARKG